MKKERFYYGEDITLANLEVVLNQDRNIVATGKLSNASKFPRVSICGVYDDEEQTMTYGVALCSHKDIFNKSIGRELARERAYKNPYKVVNIHPSYTVSETFMFHARDIENEVMTTFKVTK